MKRTIRRGGAAVLLLLNLINFGPALSGEALAGGVEVREARDEAQPSGSIRNLEQSRTIRLARRRRTQANSSRGRENRYADSGVRQRLVCAALQGRPESLIAQTEPKYLKIFLPATPQNHRSPPA